MDKVEYDLDELGKVDLKKLIRSKFKGNIYIYFLLFDDETEFEQELSVEQIEVFNRSDYSVRYISDKNLNFISEFVDRSFDFPYIITEDEVTFTFEKTSSFNLSRFTDLFIKNNVTHFTDGPDGESIIYYN